MDSDSDSDSMASGITRSSTEILKGLGSMTSGLTEAKNENIDPYLKVDLQHAKTIGFDDFLRGLGMENVQKDVNSEPITTISTAHQAALSVYLNAVRSSAEPDRYGPFCSLANGILESLDEAHHPSVQFVRGDKTFIRGVYDSAQAPDVILVRKGEKPNDKLANHVPVKHDSPYTNTSSSENNGGPPVDNWVQVLTVFEFRASDSSTRTVVQLRSESKRSSRGSKQTQSAERNSSGSRRSAADEEHPDASIKKKPKREYYEDYKVKLARYAVHMFSQDFHRRHCILVLIVDDKLIMGYFDHGGAVYSEVLDFNADLGRLVLLIKALSQLGPSQLGFIEKVTLASTEQINQAISLIGTDSNIRRSSRTTGNPPSVPIIQPSKPEGGKDHKLPQFVLKVDDRTVIVLNSIVRRLPIGLIGRGTRVHAVRVLREGNRPLPAQLEGVLALKASWQLNRRTPEWELLDKARNGLKSKGTGESGSDLAESLPVCHLQANLDWIIPDQGGDFRTKANIAYGFEENRIWRVLIFEKLETHLYTVKDEKDFQKCFREIFEAHYWVYHEAKILHRDISIFNLMVRMGSDGTMVGVLNDWDLAEDQSEVSESSESRTGTRTGTRPFMSMELNVVELPPAHILRFDLESFLYFLIWSVFVIPHTDQKVEAEEAAKERAKTGKWALLNTGAMLEGWWTKNDLSLRAEKSYTLSIRGKEEFLHSPYRFSATIEAWIGQIWDLFIDGYMAMDMAKRRMQAFDKETLGDHVTYKKIYDILKIMPK